MTTEILEEQITENTEQVQEEVPAETEQETVSEQAPEEPKTFDEKYVSKLRDESARYRQRAQRADQLAQRLHAALVTGTGLLQDPSDLPYDESHLDDPEALTAAIEALLATKPHLANRKPSGFIPQGATGAPSSLGLAGILRSNAG